MKRILFICTMLVACSTLFAQKYAVIDAKNRLSEACRDRSQIDYKNVERAWNDIQVCMVHEKSKDYHETWEVAAQIKNILTVKLYQDGQKTNTLDTLTYFNGLKDILSYYSTYEKCLTTPNEKGKLPVRDDEYKELHMKAQSSAAPLRFNLISGAYSLIHSHQKEAIDLIDVYLATFEDPLFKELKLNETDSTKANAYLYRGIAMKDLAKNWQDTLTYLSWYEKVLDSPDFGVYTVVELMNTYKEHGDKAKWEEYCKYAVEHFPKEMQFPKLLIQEYVQSERIEEAKAMCELMEKAHPEEIFPVETKALLTFNEKKYVEAIDMFKKLIELDPTYARAWCSLGTCYYQQAMGKREQVEECKKLINQAIPCYQKAQECAADEPIYWGNYLYRCYHALSDKANEAKYAKYKDM